MFTKRIVALAVVSSLLLAALPALAHEGREGKNGDNGSSTQMASPADLACMTAALDKRETAVQAGFDAYYTAAKAALGARKTALDAAWSLADNHARKDALKAAWKGYKTALRDARKTFNNGRKSAWKIFAGESMLCHPARGEGDEGGRGLDQAL